MSAPRSRRFAPRVAVNRDRGKEAAAERSAQGASPVPTPGRVSTSLAPSALGLGPGQPLPTPERRYFEHRLGANLGQVRVHPDAEAAAALGARGFAAGRDIGIAPGHWQLGTSAFRRLLGHELAHVLDQGASTPSVQLDDPLFKEAKTEEATDALSGGLKKVADKASDNDQLTGYAKALAERYALPVWNGLSGPEKAGVVVDTAAVYGVGVGAALISPAGRQTLSGVNLAFPLRAIPYATLTGFSFDAPKSNTDPFWLRFSFKGDELLDLLHSKAGAPPMTLSFDFTLSVAPDGRVTMPFALANFGVLPGVSIMGGWGLATDWKTMVQAQPGASLTPYESYPKPVEQAPPGGAGMFVSIDLLKAPLIPLKYRVLFGAVPEPKETGK